MLATGEDLEAKWRWHGAWNESRENGRFLSCSGPFEAAFLQHRLHFDPSLVGSVLSISSPRSPERKASKYIRNITVKYPFSPQIFYQPPCVINIKLSSKQKKGMKALLDDLPEEKLNRILAHNLAWASTKVCNSHFWRNQRSWETLRPLAGCPGTYRTTGKITVEKVLWFHQGPSALGERPQLVQAGGYSVG